MVLPIAYKNTLGEYVSLLGLKQLRIAETEKYAHVTFFLNGGIETVFEGEDRILVPSPKVKTYDMQPEMSALEVTEKLEEAIASNQYDFIVVNYANADMVGHTGNINAAIKAVETLDSCLGRLEIAIKNAGGVMLVTADHGNIEQLYDDVTQQAHTQHTLNPVPLVLVDPCEHYKNIRLFNGKLSDIAPTVLTLMQQKIPSEMTGDILISV
jgi:2,3-bisphosphoglycerate-independent phosphoglycerate mutase